MDGKPEPVRVLNRFQLDQDRSKLSLLVTKLNQINWLILNNITKMNILWF